MTTVSRLLAILTGAALATVPAARPAAAGVPGYVEWVLWKEITTRNPAAPDQAGAALEWVVGPYPKLSECEQERDRLAESGSWRVAQPSAGHAGAGSVVTVTGSPANVMIRLFCVPDTVNPRVDRRWP